MCKINFGTLKTLILLINKKSLPKWEALQFNLRQLGITTTIFFGTQTLAPSAGQVLPFCSPFLAFPMIPSGFSPVDNIFL